MLSDTRIISTETYLDRYEIFLTKNKMNCGKLNLVGFKSSFFRSAPSNITKIDTNQHVIRFFFISDIVREEKRREQMLKKMADINDFIYINCFEK